MTATAAIESTIAQQRARIHHLNRVGGSDLRTAEQPIERQGSDEANGKTDAQLRQDPTNHQPHDLPAAGAKRNPQPQFLLPPLHGVTGDGVESDQREDEGDNGDASDDRVAETNVPERVLHRLLERHHAVERQIGIETGGRPAQPRNRLGRISSGAQRRWP